jgi:hypothetical protein
MLESESITTIIRLGQSGWGAKRIARTLGIARNTVRRYLNAGGPVAYRQPQRASVLGGHEGVDQAVVSPAAISITAMAAGRSRSNCSGLGF